jgi:hypothetical protein
MRALLLAAAALALPTGVSAGWRELLPGLDLGSFPLESALGPAELRVLRVDPARFELGLWCATEHAPESALSARGWSEAHGLVAAINAGMFASDRTTHVGYLKSGAHLNSRGRNAYRSVASFRPRRDGLPPFRITDLDEPGASLDSLVAGYECVVQNLRLVKRERENRWSPQARAWSEAALGEDGRGRALLLFCRTPLSMHELNRQALALEELDLVAAQHLEGGSMAQLWVDAGDVEAEWVGNVETAGEGEGNLVAWAIPNVIGVRAKD